MSRMPQVQDSSVALHQSRKRPLLFISYFCGIRGNCPAEWADDKIRVLEQAGRETIVLTGMGSHVTNRPNVQYVRVPSLSWNDYKIEINELRSEGEKISLGMALFMLPALLLGIPIDFVMRKVTKGISGGRWSWMLTALPVALWLRLRHRTEEIFCTGGPTAAAVVGATLTQVFQGRLFCEFQDPLLGATMTRSSMTRKISSRIETWLVKLSQKAVYVTKEAANAARERNPAYANHIAAVYPGAWKFVQPATSAKQDSNAYLEFLHLGTLYSTRNLDSFFEALDALRAEGFALANLVRVVNLGAVYCDTASAYLAREDFQSLSALERVDALKRAQQASCLMLVQHTDERARETIPYKTYDYFNLQLPVLGLLNNDELRDLIVSCGGFAAQAGNTESIKESLRNCLNTLADRQAGIKASEQTTVDISRQFLQVLE